MCGDSDIMCVYVSVCIYIYIYIYIYRPNLKAYGLEPNPRNPPPSPADMQGSCISEFIVDFGM